MPPVVVAVAAGVAAGVAATSVVVGLAVGIGTMALSVAMKPEMPQGLAEDIERAQTLSTGSIVPRRGIYGETVVSGTIVGYGKRIDGFGDNAKEYHVVAVAIAGHHCDSVNLFRVNDKPAPEGTRFRAYLGSQTTADPVLRQIVTGWTDNHIGRGITYAVVELPIDQEKLPQGLRNITFKVKGKKVYDPRKDSSVGGNGAHRHNNPATWEWSDNPVLCAFDFLRFQGYREQPISRFDLASIAEEANVCDEQVQIQRDGVNVVEKRFTCNGSWTYDEGPAEILQRILTSCAGKPYRRGGKIYIKPASYHGPAVLEISSADLAGRVKYRPNTSERERCNVVRGTYIDPEAGYISTESPVLRVDDYVIADGAVREHEIRLPFTTSNTTAQRLQKYYLERNRAGFVVELTVGPKGLLAEPGKAVNLNLAEDGIVGEFIVADWNYDQSKKTVSMVLIIEQPELYGDQIHSRVTRPVFSVPDNTTVAPPQQLNFSGESSGRDFNGVLTWQHPAPATVEAFIVRIYSDPNTQAQGDEALIIEQRIEGTRLREYAVRDLPAGDYIMDVLAVSKYGKETLPARLFVPIYPPAAPTGINYTAGNFDLTIAPVASGLSYNSAFEFDIIPGETVPAGYTPTPKARGITAVFTGLQPESDYRIFARTVSPYGVSAWVNRSARTAFDQGQIAPFIEDIRDEIDRINTVELAQLRGDLAAAQSEIDAIVIPDLTPVNAEIDRVEGLLNSLQTNTANSLNALNSSLQALDGELSALEIQSTANNQALTTAQQDLTTLSGELDTLSGNLSTLSTDYAARFPIKTADITDSAISAAKIASSAVTEAKIANLAITAAKVADNAITTTKIADAAIAAGKIAAGAVGTTTITDLAITAEKVAALAINASKLADNAVTNAKLDALAVTEAKIASGAISADKIAASAVTEAKIATNAITAVKIAVGAITDVKIAAGAVTADKVADLAINEAKIAENAVTVGKVADGAIAAGKIALGAVTEGTIAALAVTADKVADSAVTVDKIAPGAVVESKIADAAITSLKVADLAINEAKIASNAITSAKIAAAAVSAGKIAANAVTATEIANLAITSGKLADSAITTAKIAAGAVDAGKLASAAVTTDKIAALAINADKIASNAVTTAKIADAAIASAKIASGAVDAAKLNIQVGGGNLVTDSSFEAEPVTWTTYNNSGNASTRFDTGRNGGRCRVTIVGSTPGSTLGSSKPAAVQGGWQTGVPYVVSFYARKVNGAGFTGCKLLWNNGPQSTTTLSNPTLTTSWQRYAFRIQWNAGATVPLSGGLGSLWISAAGSWVAGDEIWLDDVQVEQADVLTAYAPMVNEILPGTIGTTQIANDAITTAKLVAGAVAAGKIAASAVSATELAANAVISDKIASNAITADKITAGAVTAGKIAAGAVTANEIAAGAVTTAKLAAGSVTANEIATNAITAVKISAGAIEAGKIASNAVTSATIAAGAVTAGKVAASAITATEIATDAVTAAKIQASAVTAVKIATSAVTADKIDANAVTAAKIAAGAVIAGKIAAGVVTANEIAAAAITTAKIATSAITATQIAAAAVTAGKIAANAVTATEIAAGAITTAKLAVGAVTANEIGSNAVTAVKIAANAIEADKIATNAVTSAKILAGAIDAGKIAAAAVTAEKIATGAVVADKIAAGAVTAGKIAANAVTATEIAAGSITATKLLITGRGEVLNEDPNTQDISAWMGAGISIITDTTSPTGNTVLRCAGLSETVLSNEIPLDASRNYEYRIWVRSESGAPLTYLTVAFYDGSKALISGQGSGWSLGTFNYFGLVNQAVPASWTEYRISFGPGETATIPAGARFIRIGLLSNYGTTGTMLATGIRLYQKKDADLIVNGSIIAAKIGAGAVTTEKISAGAVTANEIASNAVTAVKIAANAIEAGKIAANAVTSATIATGAVTAGKVAANAITATEIATGAVTAAKIQANAVTAVKIAAGAVTATQIGAGAVTAGKIGANAVTANEIASNAITSAKISAGAVTATQIATNAVTADKISAGAVTAGKIAANAVTANEIAAGSITAAKLVISNRGAALNDSPNFDDLSAWWLQSGISQTGGAGGAAVAPTYITAYSGTDLIAHSERTYPIDPNKVYSLTAMVYATTANNRNMYLFVEFYDSSNNYVGGSATGWGGTKSGYTYGAAPNLGNWQRVGGQFGRNTGRPIPGNVKQVRIGVWFQYSGAGSSQVQQACQDLRLEEVIDTSLIVDGAIVASKISASAITADKIATNAVTADKIISNAVTAAKIAAGAVSADKIAANAVTADKIAANAVTAAKIAAGTITADKVAANFLRSAFVSTGGLDVTEGNNRVRIRPNNTTPILFEVNGQPTFSVNIDGTGFFAGKLADNTVEAAAITDDAKKAINPAYLGGGEKYGTSGTAVRMASGATVDIGTFTSLQAGDRVAIAFRFQEAVEWLEGFSGGSRPSYTTSSYTITLQRRIGSTGSFINVTGAINLTITPYSYGGFKPPGEPYERIVTGYSYDVNQQFTDVLASTSNHVTYRLVVTRTSGSGTTAQGLLRRQFIGEKAAYKLNELRAFSNDRRWTDKETGFSIYTGSRSFTGGQELTIFFSNPAFAEVYSVALAIDVGTAGGEQWNPQYRNLTTSSVVIRNRHNGTVTISYTIYGRVAV